jgi:hypothetical protein
VLNEQAAVALVQRWARGEPVGLRAIRDGWVTWTGGSPTAAPPAGVGRRAVVDAAAERIDRWPALDVEDIAARMAAASPEDRFPPNVRAHLEAAGWRPGRRVPQEQLDGFAATLAQLTSDRPIRLHDTARTFLAEFGGLTVVPDGRPGLAFPPVPETFSGWLLDVPEDVLGQHFCPVAIYRDGEPSQLLLGESGRSLLRAGTEFYEVAEDPDATIVDLLTRRTPRPEFDFPDDD